MKRSIVFCVFAAFGGWLFGYDIGYISGCLIMPDFIQQMEGAGATAITSQNQSIITSLLSAGTFFGAILQAFTSDRLGRKGSILFWSVIFTIGVVVQVSTFSLGQLTAGRFVAGLGVGALSAIVPLYIGEAAPKKLRGALLVLYQVQIISGLFLAYIINLGTHHISNSASWRIPIGLQLVWGLMLMGGSLLLPESPRYLLGNGKEQQAIKAIAALNDCKVEDKLTEDVMRELEAAVRMENEGGQAGWLECFSTRSRMWKRTLNGCMVQFLQQLNGQNFYYYYGPVFFEAAGTGLDAYSIQAILGGISLVMVLPAMWTIEHVGRRKSLLIGSLGQAVCAIIAALVGHFYTDIDGVSESKRQLGGNVMIAFAVFHVSLYSMFWGPTPWVLMGETFPLRVRSKCIALAAATNWLWNFLLSYFSPLIADDIGPLILLVFCGCLVFAFFYVYFMIPETRGISLEEVDELYRTKVPAWRSNSWVPSAQQHSAMDKIEGLDPRRQSESTFIGQVADPEKKTTGTQQQHVEHATPAANGTTVIN